MQVAEAGGGGQLVHLLRQPGATPLPTAALFWPASCWLLSSKGEMFLPSVHTKMTQDRTAQGRKAVSSLFKHVYLALGIGVD